MNPLMGMMGQMGANTQLMGMLNQIRQFAGMVGNRNPEQMVRNLMKQRGISESELNEAMQMARGIARNMGR